MGRHLRLWWRMVVGITLIGVVINSCLADAVGDVLSEAKVAYVKAQEKSQQALLAAFDSQLRILSQSGDLDASQALVTQRAAFVSSSELPKAPSMQAAVTIYQQSSVANETALKAAYQTAVSEYTKAQDFASATQTKLLMDQRFKATPEKQPSVTSLPADPILDALQAAKRDFQSTIKQAHAELLATIDKRANEAADKGDLEGFKRLNNLEVVVLKVMLVPGDFKDTTIQGANAKFMRIAEAAFSKLQAAYQKAISDYTKARKIEEAETVKAEMVDGGWFENFTGTKSPGQVARMIPSIDGTWEEAPGILVVVTQNQGQLQATCSYNRADFGEVRWEMKGTISPQGIISGTLQHTKAPAGFKSQHRDGQLSADGKSIVGTAKWDGGGSDFNWTRVKP
jgi:hypothetical protein